MKVVTFSGPVNIAVLKYWGKASVEHNTPTNPSLSVTLHQDDLRTVTTAAISEDFKDGDRMWLNWEEVDLKDAKKNGRVLTVLREMRRLATIDGYSETAGIRIASMNNFPTAAGLASSASGYATLVAVLADLLEAKEGYEGEFTAIARQGSGSACRSLFGGFVKWSVGSAEDGWKGSIATQVAPETHWPSLRALVLVVSTARKHVGSTEGMQHTVATSQLFKERVSNVCEKHLELLQDAIAKKDFAKFGEVTMKDSNQFHAVCADTYPPIFYMNDASRHIVRVIHAFNDACGEIRAAYTFDAGANAVVYCEEQTVPELIKWILFYFPPSPESLWNGVATFFPHMETLEEAGLSSIEKIEAMKAPQGAVERVGEHRDVGWVRRILYTRAGPGPTPLKDDVDCLLDGHTWLPKKKPAFA